MKVKGKNKEKNGAGPAAPEEKESAGKSIEEMSAEEVLDRFKIEDIGTKEISKDGRVYLGEKNSEKICMIIKPVKFHRMTLGGVTGQISFQLSYQNEVLVKEIGDGRIYIDHKSTGTEVLVVILGEDNDV